MGSWAVVWHTGLIVLQPDSLLRHCLLSIARAVIAFNTHPQIAVHGDPPSKLTERGYTHFLVDSPLDSVSAAKVRHPGCTCVCVLRSCQLAPYLKPVSVLAEG